MYANHRSFPTYANSSLAVEKKFPGDRERLARLSLIEGYFSVTCFGFVVSDIFPRRGLPQAGPHGQSRCCR